MTGKPGRYLTAEQSVRLALLDNAERQKVIEAIAKGLRSVAETHRTVGGSPYMFYSRPISAVE
jgi:hypothetical protein